SPARAASVEEQLGVAVEDQARAVAHLENRAGLSVGAQGRARGHVVALLDATAYGAIGATSLDAHSPAERARDRRDIAAPRGAAVARIAARTGDGEGEYAERRARREHDTESLLARSPFVVGRLRELRVIARLPRRSRVARRWRIRRVA